MLISPSLWKKGSATERVRPPLTRVTDDNAAGSSTALTILFYPTDISKYGPATSNQTTYTPNRNEHRTNTNTDQ